MLKKKNRISKREVNHIFKNGLFVGSKNMFLKFLINKQQKDNKIAFTAPKDVSRKAYKRNLLRRRGYLAIKDVFSYIPQGFNGIFVFKGEAISKFGTRKTKNNNPVDSLSREIESILRKI